MTTNVINDWVVKVGFDDSEVVKGAKRTQRLMNRLANKQAKATGQTAPGSATSKKRPSAFGLSDDRQLRLANSIDTVMRRAGRTIGKNSEEFKKLNGHAQALKSSIASISSRTGLERLNNQIVRLRENVNAASAAMRSQKTVAQSLKSSINNLARSYISVFAAIEGGRAFLQTGSQFDSLNASLLAASGSAEAAAEDFEFIKSTSLNLGVQLNQVADGYRQIGAAGRFSNLTTEQTKEVFLAATESARAFGLSADRAGLVYLAFSQILSKGKVSQEELRRQLGEQLPGAMSIAAKAMNVTTSELEEMIQKGISAEEFLPRFSKELRNTVRDSGALAASLNSITAANQRFTSSVQLGIVEAFGAGAKSGIINFLDRITESITQLTPLFKIFGATVGAALNIITTALDILAPVLAITFTLLGSFVQIFEEAFDLDKPAEKISLLSNAIRLLSGLFLIAVGSIQVWLGELQKLIESLGELEGGWKAVIQILGAFFALKIGKALFSPIKSVKALGSAFMTVSKSIGSMVTRLLRVLGLLSRVGSGVAAVAGTAATSTFAVATGGVIAAGSAGLGIGTLIDKGLQAAPIDTGFRDALGEGIARTLALFGNEEAQASVARLAQFDATTSGSTQVTTTNEINVNVDAPNADSREVAVMVSEAIDEKLRDNNASLASF